MVESTNFYLDSSHITPDKASSLVILRVPREKWLSRSFEACFDELCTHSFTHVEYIGSAARIWSAIALGRIDVGLFQ